MPRRAGNVRYRERCGRVRERQEVIEGFDVELSRDVRMREQRLAAADALFEPFVAFYRKRAVAR